MGGHGVLVGGDGDVAHVSVIAKLHEGCSQTWGYGHMNSVIYVPSMRGHAKKRLVLELNVR